MRDLLLSIIRRRARMGRESLPRPEGGFERIVLDSNQEIVIDGVPIGAANVDMNRGSGNPLKFVLWIVTILILATAASGYWNTLPERIGDILEDLVQPSATVPKFPDSGPVDPPANRAVQGDQAPADPGLGDPASDNDPRSKKNTY